MSESKEPTTPKVTYDQHADVLYVTFADKPAARGFEDGFGRVRRYDSDDKLIGVTFIDFTKRLADLHILK